MFKLPDGIPSFRNDAQDWADYVEYHAFLSGKVHLFSLTKPSRIVSDEEFVLGIDDETDKYQQKIDEIAAEIRRRMIIGESLYPFEMEDQDYSLRYNPDNVQSRVVYPYLLMATRAQMGNHRIQEGIDGTLLFEHLCALVAQNYFGHRAEVDILGTSKSERTSFREKLCQITHVLGEGGDIHENPGHKPQDDKVDVIVWKGFKDRQPSQIIAFGQCKTGTSWANQVSELNTEAFCKIWFTRQPVLTPVRLFFTAQYFPKELFRIKANEAGLVFDRYRILDYLPDLINKEIIGNMKKWTSAVIQYYNPNLS